MNNFLCFAIIFRLKHHLNNFNVKTIGNNKKMSIQYKINNSITLSNEFSVGTTRNCLITANNSTINQARFSVIKGNNNKIISGGHCVVVGDNNEIHLSNSYVYGDDNYVNGGGLVAFGNHNRGNNSRLIPMDIVKDIQNHVIRLDNGNYIVNHSGLTNNYTMPQWNGAVSSAVVIGNETEESSTDSNSIQLTQNSSTISIEFRSVAPINTTQGSMANSIINITTPLPTSANSSTDSGLFIPRQQDSTSQTTTTGNTRARPGQSSNNSSAQRIRSHPYLNGLAKLKIHKTVKAPSDCDLKCLVCYDENKNVMFVPCGHMSYCCGCFNRSVDIGCDSSSKKLKCPVCRTNIKKGRVVFY